VKARRAGKHKKTQLRRNVGECFQWGFPGFPGRFPARNQARNRLGFPPETGMETMGNLGSQLSILLA